MNAPDVKETLREFIRANYLGAAAAGSFGDDDSFLKRGVVDSIGILELAQFVEERFGIRVDASEILPQDFDSLNALERFVRRKTAGRKP